MQLNVIVDSLKNYYSSTKFKFYEDLFRKIEVLKVFPFSYPIYQNTDKRKIPLKYNYLLIYHVKENIILISDILYSKKLNDSK